MATLPEHARWILLEEGSRWARAIHSFGGFGEMRRMCLDALIVVSDEAACREALCARPGSVVALDVTDATFAARLEFVASIRREFPKARVVVLWPPGAANDAWTRREFALREAGAGTAARSIWDLDHVFAYVARRLRPNESRQDAVEDRIFKSLPWKAR